MKTNEKIVCSVCGAVMGVGNAHTFDGRFMCDDCFDGCTVTCDNCGERIWRDDAEGDSNVTLCSHCYEYSYITCEDCGRLIYNEDAYYEDGEDYPYCRECFEKLNDNAIKNYNYKPEPIFYGSGNLFYGVELEIDKGGEDSFNAQKLLDIANGRDERIYCKHDGSINNGFEIVSHPMSIDYHIRGDSPLSLIHIPKYKLYVYASTEEILYKALVETKLFAEIKKGAFDEIEINSGDILNI